MLPSEMEIYKCIDRFTGIPSTQRFNIFEICHPSSVELIFFLKKLSGKSERAPTRGEWYMQRLAIIVMYIIGYDYFHGQRRWTLPALIEHLQIPKGVIQDALAALKESGIILRIDSDNTFVPARDIETITLSEIVNSVRNKFQGVYSPLHDFISVPGIETIMSELEYTINSTLSKETLKELVISHIRDNKETI
jgi:DNA-binding IscR family transcriptional regulator